MYDNLYNWLYVLALNTLPINAQYEYISLTLTKKLPVK